MNFLLQEAILDGLKNAAEYFGFPEDFGNFSRSPSASKNDTSTPRKEGKKLSISGSLRLFTSSFDKGHRSSFELD